VLTTGSAGLWLTSQFPEQQTVGSLPASCEANQMNSEQMNSERTEEFPLPVVSPRVPDEARDREASPTNDVAPRAANREAAPKADAARSDTSQDKQPQSQEGKESKSASEAKSAPETKAASQPKPPPKKVLQSKVKMQSRLPALDDDADVGKQKQQVVTRDGKADLTFDGTLLASAAPAYSPNGHWQEYRVYETTGGKHVFSKVERTVFAEEEDSYAAEVFDPSPSSMPSQLLRSARELTRSKPLEWTDAAVAFFGYDPLAKALYRKLSGKFEEHIS
jgi:hypothetical protein